MSESAVGSNERGLPGSQGPAYSRYKSRAIQERSRGTGASICSGSSGTTITRNVGSGGEGRLRPDGTRVSGLSFLRENHSNRATPASPSLEQCVQPRNLGRMRSAFSQSIARSSLSVNPPSSRSPLVTMAADPPPSGKSVPKSIREIGTIFLEDGSV